MQWRVRWSCTACTAREGHVQACLLCSPSPNQLCSNQDCFRNWSDGGSEWKGKIAISLQILFASMDSIWDTSCLTSGIAGEGNCSVWLLTVTDHRASTFFGFFLFSRKSLNCSKTQSSSWVQCGYVVWTIHAPQIAIHHNPRDACLNFRCLDLPWDTVSKKMLV